MTPGLNGLEITRQVIDILPAKAAGLFALARRATKSDAVREFEIRRETLSRRICQLTTDN